MTTLIELQVNSSIIKVVKSEIDVKFNGQKILHPFGLDTKFLLKNDKNGTSKQVPIGTYYKNSNDIATTELLKSCKRFDIKHDGSCGAIVWNEELKQYEPYARFDIKKNKQGEFFNASKTDKWIECESKPTHPEATHHPHFRPCSEDKKAYKWNILAFDLAKEKLQAFTPDKHGKIITVEYVGKKFNYNKSDSIEEDARLVVHGSLQVEVPEELRNYDGFMALFKELPTIEGLVAYTDMGPLKIKREMFFGLAYPGEPYTYLQKYGLDHSLTSYVVL